MAAHTIRFHPDEALLAIRLSGFWSMADFRSFADDLATVLQRLDEAGVRFDTLSDSADFPVQSADVAEAFVGVSAMMGHRSGRCAIVVAGRLNQLQAQRALAHDRIRVFLDAGEARRWLLEPDA